MIVSQYSVLSRPVLASTCLHTPRRTVNAPRCCTSRTSLRMTSDPTVCGSSIYRMSISVSGQLYLPHFHLQPFQLRSKVVQERLQEVSPSGQGVPQFGGAVLPVTLEYTDGTDRSIAVVAEIHADNLRVRITVKVERVLVADVDDGVPLEDLDLVVRQFARATIVHGTLRTVELGLLDAQPVDARLAALAGFVHQRYLARGKVGLWRRRHISRRHIAPFGVLNRQCHLTADGARHLTAFNVLR